ncbi:MAG: TlpA family protein disulfide reductase [Flavobacteriales bacterium]|nr:TlpA family protein disulfide reductase [Flavobacteriales bacterium]
MKSKVPVLIKRASLIFFLAMLFTFIGPIVFGSYTENVPTRIDFSLTDIDGNTWKSNELRGSVVVFNFWFTSCPPCKKEIPELNKLVDSYANKNVVFIGVSLNGADEVEGFTYMHPFKYKLIADGEKFIDQNKVSSFPTQFIVDKNGNLVDEIVGSVDFYSMKEIIDKLL